MPRSSEQRKSDALSALTSRNTDLWVATSSSTGRPHLVPMSLSWDGEHVVLATEATSMTSRHIIETGRATLALGKTRDVVMIDAVHVDTVHGGDASTAIADRYQTQSGWDPRTFEADPVYILLRPDRIQVWRDVDENDGRTVMREGHWLV